jgi:hypothetical protein
MSGTAKETLPTPGRIDFEIRQIARVRTLWIGGAVLLGAGLKCGPALVKSGPHMHPHCGCDIACVPGGSFEKLPLIVTAVPRWVSPSGGRADVLALRIFQRCNRRAGACADTTAAVSTIESDSR